MKSKLIKQIANKCLPQYELNYNNVVDLEDVLTIITQQQKKIELTITHNPEKFTKQKIMVLNLWQLNKPLSKQSKECLEFIWSIIN